MKLTGAQSGSVQSLGRESGVSSSTGKANLALAIADEVDVYQQRKAKHQSSLSDAALVTWDSDFKKKYDGQERINVADLPKAMQNEYATETDVPAFEVRATLYEQQLGEFLATQSETISNKRTRDEWLLNKKSVGSQHIAQRYVNRDNEQREYYNKEAVQAATEAADNDQYPTAIALINNSDLDGVEKKKLVHGIEKQQESNLVDDMILSKDIEGLKKMSAMLSSSDYDGPFKDEAERLTLKNKIKSNIATFRNEFEKYEVWGKAQGKVHTIVNSGKTRTEQLADARAIKNEQTAKETVRQLKLRHAEEDAADAKELKTKKEDWWEKMKATPSDELFSSAPDAATESAGRTWLAQRLKEGAIKTDLKAYHEVNSKILNGQFVELMDYQGKLSDSDFKKMSDRLNNPESALTRSGMSVDREIKNRLFDMGISADAYTKNSAKGEAARAMYEVLNTEFALATEARGQTLTVRERTELFDRVTMATNKEKDSDYKLFTVAGDDIALKDIPEGELQELVEALRMSGRQVTAENIRRLYVDE